MLRGRAVLRKGGHRTALGDARYRGQWFCRGAWAGARSRGWRSSEPRRTRSQGTRITPCCGRGAAGAGCGEEGCRRGIRGGGLHYPTAIFVPGCGGSVHSGPHVVKLSIFPNRKPLPLIAAREMKGV